MAFRPACAGGVRVFDARGIVKHSTKVRSGTTGTAVALPASSWSTSAEDIAARFGVTPQVVRQRLRLGAVSPKLMQVYRDGGLTLEQLMAFGH